MTTLLQDSFAVEMMDSDTFCPTTQDLEDYAHWAAEVDARWQAEREDRIDTMERIRRADFDNARSAACIVRGIAGSLRCQGLGGVAERLLAASEDVLNLVMKYA